VEYYVEKKGAEEQNFDVRWEGGNGSVSFVFGRRARDRFLNRTNVYPDL
jgi:hypothetical protein